MIVNKKKFTRAMVVISLSLIMLFSIYKGFVYAYHEGQKIPKEYKEILVTIKEGDEAWEIQKDLTPNEDVRKVLYYASKVNGKENMEQIFVGETLVFFEIAK